MSAPRAHDDVDPIGQLALELSSAHEPADVHDALRRFAAALTPMTGLFVSRYDPSSQTRTCVYAWSDGAPVDVATLPRMGMNEGPASQAILQQRAIVTSDYSRLLQKLPRVDVGLDRDPRLPESSIVVPMMARGQPLGAIEVQSPERDAFGPREVAVLQLVASLAALALENLERVSRAQADLMRHAVARGLVRKLMQGVARKAGVRPDALRALGRDLARDAHAGDLDGYTAAYTSMGLGQLDVERTGDRCEFTGRDLLEYEAGSVEPTCYLTLGFLEGAVAAATGSRALGTEIACQSQGKPACRFLVSVRRDPPLR